MKNAITTNTNADSLEQLSAEVDASFSRYSKTVDALGTQIEAAKLTANSLVDDTEDDAVGARALLMQMAKTNSSMAALKAQFG